MIDFIIPSIGRNTLHKSLASLLGQTDPNWKCYVGFDGLDKDQIKLELPQDDRIQYFYLSEKLGTSSHHGNAGKVRNKIISLVKEPNEWVGFLDDDDSLSRYYIEILKNELKKDDCDCIVFRMNLNGDIIPPFSMNELRQNYVGISFCVKREFIMKNKIQFENNNAEDFMFLQEVARYNGKIKLLPFVGYFVGK